MIDGFETVLYSGLFLLPGGIIQSIIRTITPARKMSSGQEVLRWLAYSIVNNAIWSWAYWLLYSNVSSESILFWVILVGIVLVSSFITGLFLGAVKYFNIGSRIAAKMNVVIEHSIPTAWDYVFSKRKGPCYVIISLDDGTTFYGYYGPNSMASSDTENMDLYLEYIYSMDDDGDWKPIEDRRGVWINSASLRSIEFIDPKEEDKNEQ